MPASKNYADKFAASAPQTAFFQLDPFSQEFIRQRATRYRFTFQELKQVCEAALDLQMWRETPLHAWWAQEERAGKAQKKELLRRLQASMHTLRSKAKSYPEEAPKPAPHKLALTAQLSPKNRFGRCPVATEETVCCNLHTLDAVENCGLGCSYCTIQTFYGEQVVFDADLRAKLQAIEVQPERFYHIGTGQSSDSLMWGNQHGTLDALCDFARQRDNVLLEFKTKSKNVSYFLGHDPPRNIVLSWSLNTPTIIDHEEHFTARLEQRLDAARQVADRRIKVAFHFHPMVYYDGWKEDYRRAAEQVMARFDPAEVLFISFGAMTFIKPAVKAIRQRAWASKVLQMELLPGPKGKLSYPDEIKRQLFGHIYRVLAPWHDEVFFYLCMEKAALWRSTFGRVYADNEAFAADFAHHVKIKRDFFIVPTI